MSLAWLLEASLCREAKPDWATVAHSASSSPAAFPAQAGRCSDSRSAGCRVADPDSSSRKATVVVVWCREAFPAYSTGLPEAQPRATAVLSDPAVLNFAARFSADSAYSGPSHRPSKTQRIALS